MTSETFKDSFDRKTSKQNRPKLLKLTEVSMPNRSRKKSKLKVKPRSQSNVRDRIYDDPAYTDDISHLAIPLRRNSGPDKLDHDSGSHKKKSSHKDGHHLKRAETNDYQRGGDDSSSSDNIPPDPGRGSLGRSLERSVIIEKSPNKHERRDRAAKQKRNLSLDNTLSNSLRRSLEKANNDNYINFNSVDRAKQRQKSIPRQNVSEGWSSCLTATSDSSKNTENEDMYSASRKEQSTVQLGKRLLKGEIGIKSFNYYLLKEGLKSSRKFIDKQRGTLSKNDPKRTYSKSEENIYEEIFFTDKNSESEDHSKYPDCEICIRQCTKENCEYCYANIKAHSYQAGHEPENYPHPGEPVGPNAHILQYQSYNPNNPGVYKIETTPVAFTSDYNPIYHIQTEIKPASQMQNQADQQRYAPRRNSRTGISANNTFRMNAKSSSSSDSLQHKYARDRSSQDSQDISEYTQPVIIGLPRTANEYDQNIYKSDSKVSIISEYSLRSESSTNRNFRCGEVSDSSLGDSLFSYSTQRRFFGSSESCRFGFECRRCSLDGEKCSFSDTCRYECRNCDCSSSYFSSDFDDGNYSRRTPTRLRSQTHTQPAPRQRTYEYYDDMFDAKQNKYAQDFIKHVNDVKRSLYQSEIQRTTIPSTMDSYGTIPPPKQSEMRKIIAQHQQTPPPPSNIRLAPHEQTSRMKAGIASPLKMSKHSLSKTKDQQSVAIMKEHISKLDESKGSTNKRSGKLDMAGYKSTEKHEPASTTPSSDPVDNRKSSRETTTVKYATVVKEKRKPSDGAKHSPEREQRRSTGAIPKSSPITTSSHSKTHATTNPIEGSASQRQPTSPRTDNAKMSQGNVSVTVTTSTPSSAASETRTTTGDESDVRKKKSPRRNEKEISKQADKNGAKINLAVSGANKQAAIITKDENQQLAKSESKVISPSPEHREKAKSKLPKPEPVEVSDFDDDDDDDEVFIDESKKLDDKQKVPSKTKDTSRKRCFALPATPNTPNKGQQPRNGIDAPSTIEGADERKEMLPPHPEKEESTDAERFESDIQKAPAGEPTVKAPPTTTAQQIVESAKTAEIPACSTVVLPPDCSSDTIVDSGTLQELQHTDEDGESKNRAKPQPVNPLCSQEMISPDTAQDTVANGSNFSHKSDAAGVATDRDIDRKIKDQENTEADIAPKLLETQPTVTEQPQSVVKPQVDESFIISALDKIDFSDLPLPAIPPKKKRSRTGHLTPKFSSTENVERHLNQRTSPINDGQRSLPRTKGDLQRLQDRDEFKRMHYYNSGRMPTSMTATSVSVPTYLFGETRISSNKKSRDTDEIFLNKSGWVQVNSKRTNIDPTAGRNHRLNVLRAGSEEKASDKLIRVIHIDPNDDKPVYAVPRMYPGSKVEELIARNDARRGNPTPKGYLRAGYKVDPHVASILNERPGFLPVKRFSEIESPPPVTPILSPPPAFQDSKTRRKPVDTNKNGKQAANMVRKSHENVPNPKGMVFSRSFEYDNRKPADYAETFSKSFDSNLSNFPPDEKEYDATSVFATLTGRSPNYLTKKESSRDSSPKYQDPADLFKHPKQKKDTPIYSVPHKVEKSIVRQVTDRNTRSRRSQFSRTLTANAAVPTSRFRNFDASVASQRLNSCDSGARSDLSNDEVDNDDTSPNQYLSATYQSPSSFKNMRQRSITPERYQSNNYQNNLRKQRSLTPESRSLTPEDRRKKGSQASLNSRRDSGSRNSTLERMQKYDEKSRSPSRSSSSSYSGGEHDATPNHRRPGIRNSRDDHRIRRSRSLQLSERSPSRMAQLHKTVVCLGQNNMGNVNTVTPNYHQPLRSFPPSMRPTQYTEQMPTSRITRSTEVDKSRSFDLDYGHFATANISSKMDFDKTRSFDETYREPNSKLRYKSDLGSSRNFASKQQKIASTIPRQTSPQNYGTRLCDHELTYDMLRRTLDRSPIMDFSRDYDVPVPTSAASNRNYDMHSVRGDELNFLNERIYDHGKKLLCDQSPGDAPYPRDILTPTSYTPESEYKSMRDSFQQSGGDRMPPTTDYIYRQPTKGQMTSLQPPNQQQRSLIDRNHPPHSGPSASIRGSCSASSCDFWPHCGLRTLKTSPIKSQSVEPMLKANSISSCSATLSNSDAFSDDDDDDCELTKIYSDGSGNVIELDLKVDDALRNEKSATSSKTRKFEKKCVKDSKKYPPFYVNLPIRKSTPTPEVLLEKHEMPVTRDRENEHDVKMAPVAGRHFEPQSTRIGAEIQAGSNTKTAEKIAREAKEPVYQSKSPKESNTQIKHRQRSASLPNLSIHSEILSLSASCDGLFQQNSFTNLESQLKAVSSPSIPDNSFPDNNSSRTDQCNVFAPIIECNDRIKPNLRTSKPPEKQSHSANAQHNKAGQPKKSESVTTTDSTNSESTRYRFGNLIWRSSKERRKVKYNRKDKCNSGDSGIQIELENDELCDRTGIENLEIPPFALNTRVRRVNSAKSARNMTSFSSAKAKALRKVENSENKLAETVAVPKRSLSQPLGLDRISATGYDESDADSAPSHLGIHDQPPVYAEVLFAFTPEEPQELALERGELIQVVRQDTGVWWYGRVKCDAVVEKVLASREGWFPKDYVRIIPNGFELKTDCSQHSIAKGTNIISRELTLPLCTNLQHHLQNNTVKSSQVQSNHERSESLRNSVIKELLETEINYVKLLTSLCMGYLREMRKRIDIFTPESLHLIFSNIESIWQFQQRFLDALRRGIESGRIAQVFLNNCANFMVYSTYCNSYPRALMELETYSTNKDAKRILEICRIAEHLPELPLSAHLLAPIQRICRYPLHLAELAKHSQSSSACGSHDDDVNHCGVCDSKETLENALSAMKKVAETVNEGKRHSENLNRFQSSFENFEGPPIAFHSTRFFMQTDVTRISPNIWNNTYTLFLFDGQIIYCKKDILKRNHYIYKGRIFLDDCRILNLPDGKIFGANLKNALRMYCQSRRKWFDFCFRSSSRKIRFLSTLSAERQFSGKSLFISELAGEEDNLSDVDYHSDQDTTNHTSSFEDVNWKNVHTKRYGGSGNVASKQKFSSDTLPKKSRKTCKDNYEYSTGSLGRKKIGGWFRKAKSTSTTPTQSPTHHHSPLVFNSESSSQSSPALGYAYPKAKTKEPAVSTP